MDLLSSIIKPKGANIIAWIFTGASLVFGASGFYYSNKFTKQQHEINQDSLIIKTVKSVDDLTKSTNVLAIMLKNHIAQQDTSSRLIKKLYNEMDGTKKVVTALVKSNELMRKDFDHYFFMMYPMYNMTPIHDSVKQLDNVKKNFRIALK